MAMETIKTFRALFVQKIFFWGEIDKGRGLQISKRRQYSYTKVI